MILYDSITHIVFHSAGELWLELRIAEGKQNLLPANILCEGTVLYLKVNNAFVTDKFKAFKNLREQGLIEASVKIERNFESCFYLEEHSVTLKNFEMNTKYNKVFSSDFHNF